MKHSITTKQLPLTDEQRDVLKRLEAIFKVAEERHIGFVFDYSDNSLSAYNNENIDCCYNETSIHRKEDESDRLMDWSNVEEVNATIDCFISDTQYYFIKFKEE